MKGSLWHYNNQKKMKHLHKIFQMTSMACHTAGKFLQITEYTSYYVYNFWGKRGKSSHHAGGRCQNYTYFPPAVTNRSRMNPPPHQQFIFTEQETWCEGSNWVLTNCLMTVQIRYLIHWNQISVIVTGTWLRVFCHLSWPHWIVLECSFLQNKRYHWHCHIRWNIRQCIPVPQNKATGHKIKLTQI